MKKKILFVRRKKPIRETLEPVRKRLQCSNCSYVFSDYLTSCPECGSEDWIGYTEVNPYTRMPLESFLKACGHVVWILGTFVCLYFLWQTNSSDEALNVQSILLAIVSLGLGILLSALYFGLSEAIQRILRVQRRLKAFHETHRHGQQSVIKPQYTKTGRRKKARL